MVKLQPKFLTKYCITILQIKDSTGSVKNIKQLISDTGDLIPLSALIDTNGLLIEQNNGLPIMFADNSKQAYQFSMKIVPTTLGINTVYAAIRNGNPTKNLQIDLLNIKQLYTGTPSLNISEYELVSFAGATAIAGGVAQTIGKRIGTNIASLIEVKASNTGGIVPTGAGVATNGIIVAHINQNTANNDFTLNLKGQPMILAPNQGVLIRSLSPIALGSSNFVTILFREL